MKTKNLILAAAFLTVAAGANAQQSINVVKGSVAYSFSSSATGLMNYTSGTTVNIGGVDFALNEIDKMEVVDSEMDNNSVLIQYNDDTAFVTVAGNIAKHITATVNGAHVTLDQGSGVGDGTGEITYVLKGESANGSFTMNGSYKTTIELQGLTLTNPSGGAIDIENGKRIGLSVKNGTVNNLTDGAKGDQKAALYCKGHLEIKGKGTLNVSGKAGHAIGAKEYVEMKNCTINILESAKDGINCAQYFLIESGTLNISNVGEDGIQTAFKDEKDPEAEDTGTITIAGGTVNIENITGTACKALKADADFVMTDGELNAMTSAPGEWDSKKEKVKASACIGVDGNIRISGGTLNLKASGGGAKGITADGYLTFNSATLSILTSGGVLAYVGKTLYQDYAGSFDNVDGDAKSSPKGVKVDGNVTINGGTIDITTSGTGGEGIETKSKFTLNDGAIKIRSRNDAINSTDHMYIKGGTIDVISTGNDGLDSNGSIYIEGGHIMAFGSSYPECGIDSNDKGGYTIIITGGYLLAAGGKNSVPSSKSTSTQPYVSVNTTLLAGSTVEIGTASETVYTFTTPDDLTSVNLGGSQGNRPGGDNGMGKGESAVIISVPGLVSGTNYTVKSGSSSVTGSATLTDPSSK